MWDLSGEVADSDGMVTGGFDFGPNRCDQALWGKREGWVPRTPPL
jgi:hypothetical protein